jgi:hypothetical protein
MSVSLQIAAVADQGMDPGADPDVGPGVDLAADPGAAPGPDPGAGRAADLGADPGPDYASIAAVASTLLPVPSDERRDLLRPEAALLLDRLLVRVVRGRGPLDLALGAGLSTLLVGDRLLRLGFSGLRDYARERLGIAGSTAEKLARLSSNLAERPLLRAAVQSGAVTARKAETIVAVARGADEAAWVARARKETVRSLAAGVREALGDASGAEAEEERWERVGFTVRGESGPKLDRALALAGKLLGATAPPWQRLEAICEEYLGSHPVEPPAEVAPGVRRAYQWLDHAPSGQQQEELKVWLEHESRQWEFLRSFDPAPRGEWVAAGTAAAGGSLAVVLAGTDGSPEAGGAAAVDLLRLDADLRRLRSLQLRWDELLGHLAFLVRQSGLWRDMQFVSFDHYCTERLGLSERNIGQRIALERRLYWLPELRVALREGRISYEKARIVAFQATERTLPEWLARAAQHTCIELARQAEAGEEAQMCAQGQRIVRMPLRVAELLELALLAASQEARRDTQQHTSQKAGLDTQQVASPGLARFITPSEALERIAEHFIATWEPLLKERNTVQKRVLERDGGLCKAPGCSRAAIHVHHVEYRSHLGDDQPENLLSLCAGHHLRGVHAGYIRVRGQAPDRLAWSGPVAVAMA